MSDFTECVYSLFLTPTSVSITNLGVSGADSFCSSQATSLGYSGLSPKALLTDETACSNAPCRRASVTAITGDGQIDWPLLPNSTYYTLDLSTFITTTDSHGLLNYPFVNKVTTTCRNFPSGMHADFTSSTASCSNFQNASSSLSLKVGWSCDTTSGFFSGGSMLCSTGSGNFYIMCATTVNVSLPTAKPTPQRIRRPTNESTGQPTSLPSMQSSNMPSSVPSNQPTSPTSQPCSESTQPSSQLSSQPSRESSCQPSREPSYEPAEERLTYDL